MVGQEELAVRYWVPDAKAAWLPCQLKARDGSFLTFVADDGRELRQPSSVLPTLRSVRHDELEGLDDICALASVWEGGVLHTLRRRYQTDKIYTRISRGILIAVNPFRNLPAVYCESVQARYKEADCCSLPPHIFGLTQDASQRLRLPDSRNQTVLVSGESGSGKTESTKHILSYLLGSACGIEKQILSTTPILEAFGNAVTTRNSNSSRFGKWLDVRLSYVGGSLQVHGCTLTHYLLETMRVCHHAPGETGYHIFYRLLQAPTEFLGEFGLVGDSAIYKYLATCQQNSDQVGGLLPIQEALNALGIGNDLQRDLFRVLASILLLGNCEFEEVQLTEGNKEGCQLTEDSMDACQHAAELLGLDQDRLVDCMLVATRHIAGNDVTRTPRRPEEAQSVRDALARLLYNSVFDWLVQRMNEVLMPGSAAQTTSGTSCRSFGVLDIAGFENFETNSLEQLLINLSNEHLQQLFNSAVFKTEIQDCEAEGIPVVSVLDFHDNKDCLELLDGTNDCALKREPGILDLLDEAVTMPSATDATFIAKVVAKFSSKGPITGNVRFIAPRFGGCPTFTVKHYARDISYNCDGWIEKNSNRQPPRTVELLTSSKTRFVQCLGIALEQNEAGALPSRGRGRAGRIQSASHSFRMSLRSLMGRVAESELHFIRCVKPREHDNERGFFGCKVAEQLRSGGILEAVRIRQGGYSSRWSFSDFVARFKCIVASRVLPQSEPRSSAEELVSALHNSSGFEVGAQELLVGKTKVFARATAAATLETQRARVTEDSVLVLQRLSHVLRSRQRMAALRLGQLQQEMAVSNNTLQTDDPVDPCAEASMFQDVVVPLQEMSPSTSEWTSREATPCQVEETRLTDELRALQTAVSSRDEGLLRKALEGGEAVRFVEELLAAARGTLVPLQRARESLDDAVRQATEVASDANIEALRKAITQGESAGLAQDRLAAARIVLNEAKKAAPMAALQRARESLDVAIRNAALNATEVNIDVLRRCIEQGVSIGLPKECLAAANESMREAEETVAQRKRLSASHALDDNVRNVTKNASELNVEMLRRAIDRAVSVGLAEEQVKAAKDQLMEAQRTAALVALERARAALERAVKSACTGRAAAKLDPSIDSLRKAIDQGKAAGLHEDELRAAWEAIAEAPKVPALAAMQRAHEALKVAVTRDLSVNAHVQDLQRTIERCATAGVSEDQLAQAKETMRQAPKTAALVALDRAREAFSNSNGATDTIEALQRAINRCTAARVSEDQLGAARIALQEAREAAARTALQNARQALEITINSHVQNTPASIDGLRMAGEMQIGALQNAIDDGVAAGLSEEQLATARETLQEGNRVTAVANLQFARRGLDSAVRSGRQNLSANIEALRISIDRGAAIGLSEEQLEAAREAIRTAPVTAASAALRGARDTLNIAIRTADPNVDVSIRALQNAIDRGTAAGIVDEELAAAREAMRDAPRAAASATLRHAYDAMRSDTERNIETMQRAIDQGAVVDGFPEGQLAAARETLQEAKITAALARLQVARVILHSAPHVGILNMNINTLQAAIHHAEAVGVLEDRLATSREEIARAALDQAADALNTAVASISHRASNRNISLLERAIHQAVTIGVEERHVTRARATLTETQRMITLQPVDECSICLEEEVTSTMPCCSREGSGNRICSTCLARHTEETRQPRCPFCRSAL